LHLQELSRRLPPHCQHALPDAFFHHVRGSPLSSAACRTNVAKSFAISVSSLRLSTAATSAIIIFRPPCLGKHWFTNHNVYSKEAVSVIPNSMQKFIATPLTIPKNAGYTRLKQQPHIQNGMQVSREMQENPPGFG
jgi:hypothetical protein